MHRLPAVGILQVMRWGIRRKIHLDALDRLLLLSREDVFAHPCCDLLCGQEPVHRACRMSIALLPVRSHHIGR